VVPSFLSGGFLANSLAIMNDALHQFFDLNTLLMSLIASWMARWTPNEKKTFGYYRAGKNDFLTRYKTCYILALAYLNIRFLILLFSAS